MSLTIVMFNFFDKVRQFFRIFVIIASFLYHTTTLKQVVRFNIQIQDKLIPKNK